MIFQSDEQTALITLEETWTAGALVSLALGVASQLPDAKVLAFVARDPFKTLVLMLACWQRGIVFCPLSPRLALSQYSARAGQAGALLFEGKIDWGRRAEGELDLEVGRIVTALFTSGSTGNPKVISHTLSAHLASGRSAIRALGLNSTSIWQLSLPLHHIGGIAAALRVWLAGGSVSLPHSGTVPTHTSVVPTQLQRMLKEWPGGVAIVGGAPIPEGLVERARAESIAVHTTYGMTETASMVALDGRPLAGCDIKIAEGEICVRGAMVAAEGWLHTGDLGYFDTSGALQVRGRLDNQFISGGENIQPEEIEAALMRFPDVRAAIVVDVPCREYGARPFAFVDGSADPALLKGHLESFLERFKIPVHFEPWTFRDIKPNRNELRHRATALWQGEGAFSRGS